MFLGAMEGRSGADHGVGVGRTIHRGRAVVAVDPEDAAARVTPGDVLVTTTTTPAFNCVLPIAGALVTAHGGLMSHAGIAARELGIPAVLGVADALERHPRRGDRRGRPGRGHRAVGAGTHRVRAGRPHAGGRSGRGRRKAAGLIDVVSLGLPVPAGVVLPASLHRSGAGAIDDAGAGRRGRAGADHRAAARRPRAAARRQRAQRCRRVDAGDDGHRPRRRDDARCGRRARPATTGDTAFADDTYRRFLLGYASTVGGLADAATRSAATTPTPALLAARLADLGCVVPADPIDQVIAATTAVCRSWDGERARSFRRREGIDDDAGDGGDDPGDGVREPRAELGFRRGVQPRSVDRRAGSSW